MPQPNRLPVYHSINNIWSNRSQASSTATRKIIFNFLICRSQVLQSAYIAETEALIKMRRFLTFHTDMIVSLLQITFAPNRCVARHFEFSRCFSTLTLQFVWNFTENKKFTGKTFRDFSFNCWLAYFICHFVWMRDESFQHKVSFKREIKGELHSRYFNHKEPSK